MGRKLLLAAVLLGWAFGATAQEWQTGLSDRELAIQRWFSYLTFMQGHAADPWTDWHDDGSQLGVTAFRYQIAFCGYGCAAMAAQTPAYRELAKQQLLDLCERIIDRRCWHYVTHYWNYGEDPPDPCLFENVMYTGHVTQLMCLYELLTGDRRYSEEGWDFTWTDGRAVHYTLEKAVEGLHRQSIESPTGGICCEPGQVFADCNDHSANSFLLHDLMYGTHYADANERWFKWMSTRFRNKIPFTREFLYVVYDQNKKVFIPVGDVGADCWALGWGYPWFPDTGFAEKGWKHLLRRAKWRSPASGQRFARNNAVIGCCGGGSLGVANAFIPLAGVQAEGAAGARAGEVLAWLEAQYGREIDTDGDGHAESYCYQTCPMHRISATGNIAAALATDGDSMRQLYRTLRTDILNQPTLAHVDYPNVFVRAAEYRAPILRFVAVTGHPGVTGETEFVCTQLPGPVQVSRDGEVWHRWTQEGTTVRIQSDVDVERVFEVRCAK